MSSPARSSWAASPSLLRYSHRSSSSSLNNSISGSNPFTGQASNIASPSPRPPSTSGWSNLALKKQSTGSTIGIYAGSGEEMSSTKSWTFMGFEWEVRNVRKLRDVIEGVLSESNPSEAEPETEINEEGELGTPSEADDFEILKHSPVIGDGKFKLEIARTAPPNEGPPSNKPQGLSLYITPSMLEFAHPQYEMSATMMAGIKCQEDRAGERGARADWPFEVWHDWIFRQDNEVWECALPSLSTLLENPRISDTDSFVICVQIHSPVGPSLPAQPFAYYVPKDLLDGLEASLDNPNTGDVQFICLERPPLEPLSLPNTPVVMSPTTRPSSSTSSNALPLSPFASEMTARKRVIYAHSDVLIHRSEYFATMLSSSFAENQNQKTGDSLAGRKLFTVVVEEADFETIYWLLKYVYANWLLFKEVDDPRAAVEGVGRGWSAHWLTNTAHHRSGGGEWDWKTFPKHGPPVGEEYGAGTLPTDTTSATSGDSLDSRARSPSGKAKNSAGQHIRSTTTPGGASRVSSGPGSTHKVAPVTAAANATRSSGPSAGTPSTAGTGRRVASSSSMSLSANIPSGSSSVPTKTVPMPLTSIPPATNYPSSAGSHYPVSPHSQRPRGSSRGSVSNPISMAVSDPHLHPTPPPPPASALAMYQVAHRYAMPGLSTLALDHMMQTITPASSFALLLAVSAWDELKGLVEDYVVDKWDEVSISEEFEICCQEVAAGEWGPEGGKTLMALFRRLRSPGTLMYTRS